MDVILFMVGGAFALYVLYQQYEYLNQKYELKMRARISTREKFIEDHSEYMPEDIAGEFWDLYH